MLSTFESSHRDRISVYGVCIGVMLAEVVIIMTVNQSIQ